MTGFNQTAFSLFKDCRIYEITCSLECLSFKLLALSEDSLLILFANYLKFFSVLETRGHCMGILILMGTPWYLPEALSISCQAQTTEVTMN